MKKARERAQNIWTSCKIDNFWVASFTFSSYVPIFPNPDPDPDRDFDSVLISWFFSFSLPSPHPSPSLFSPFCFTLILFPPFPFPSTLPFRLPFPSPFPFPWHSPCFFPSPLLLVVVDRNLSLFQLRSSQIVTVSSFQGYHDGEDPGSFIIDM